MTATGRTIIGVFHDEGAVDRTMQDLRDAGYGSDQIYYTGTAPTGDVLATLRSLLTGRNTGSDASVANDLQDMGVSSDEVSYYENEYTNGNTFIAVQVQEDDAIAMSILQSNGAYNYATRNRETFADGGTSGRNSETRLVSYDLLHTIIQRRNILHDSTDTRLVADGNNLSDLSTQLS